MVLAETDEIQGAVETSPPSSTDLPHAGPVEVLPAADQAEDDFETGEVEQAAIPDASDVEEKLFGEEPEPIFAEPALAAPVQEATEELPAPAEGESVFDKAAGCTRWCAFKSFAEPDALAGELEWAKKTRQRRVSPWVRRGPWRTRLGRGMGEGRAGRGGRVVGRGRDFEIIYEQLPATADEVAEEEAVEPAINEDDGFDALLSNEQLLEGFDAEDDDLLHGAAQSAELHAHGPSGGRNGNSVGSAPQRKRVMAA